MPAKKKTKKKSATKKSARNKPALRMKSSVKKKSKGNKKKRAARGRGKRTGTASRSAYAGSRAERAALAGGQSGDLQGLSSIERADSESVDELLEEGNAFEAGVVEGVEEAGAKSEREVHTREVPEDDVPGEYLDRDE
jgi:hypothetical protein